MDTILFRGKRLKIVHFNGQLYRADCETFRVGSSASLNYRGAPMKYFTLEKQETYSYSRRGYPFIKTWQTTEPLILIDIFNIPTRNALKELIESSGNHSAINTAFPLHPEGFVYRVSEENTKNKDDDVLRSLCELGVFDGYYMGRQASRGNGLVSSFHSEVGLCPDAFRKLTLAEVEKDREAPPCMKNMGIKRGKTRRVNRNNNGNKNNRSNKRNRHNNNNRNKNNSKNTNESMNGPWTRKRPRINYGKAPPKFSLMSFDD